MGNPSFCSNCGSPVATNARLCPKCGSLLHTVSAPDNSGKSSQEGESTSIHSPGLERVEKVLSGALRRTGFGGLKMEPFVVILTNMRIIYAAQTKEMMKENIRLAKENAKNAGKGFFGKIGAQLTANSGEYYYQMAPHEILAEQPVNYFHHAGQIESIRIKQDYDAEDTNNPYNVTIEADGKKEKFQFYSLDEKSLKTTLRQLYGDVVR